MNNKRLDEIYKQILSYLEDPSFYKKYDHYLDKFKKYLTSEDLEKFYQIFKDNNLHLHMLICDLPNNFDTVESIFKLIVSIYDSKKILIKFLAMEAIIFERDKYYAKSTMCKACKEIRLNAFAKYERMKNLLC